MGPLEHLGPGGHGALAVVRHQRRRDHLGAGRLGERAGHVNENVCLAAVEGRLLQGGQERTRLVVEGWQADIRVADLAQGVGVGAGAQGKAPGPGPIPSPLVQLLPVDAGVEALDHAHALVVAEAPVELAVAETNQGYANSGVGINMELAHYRTVNYNDVGHSTDLARFRSTSDGYFDDIHTTRLKPPSAEMNLGLSR